MFHLNTCDLAERLQLAGFSDPSQIDENRMWRCFDIIIDWTFEGFLECQYI